MSVAYPRFFVRLRLRQHFLETYILTKKIKKQSISIALLILKKNIVHIKNAIFILPKKVGFIHFGIKLYLEFFFNKLTKIAPLIFLESKT